MKNFIQILNPKSHRYVLINKDKGKIIKHHPHFNKPYKNITIIKYIPPYGVDEIFYGDGYCTIVSTLKPFKECTIKDGGVNE
jgi:hypothetical protein